MHLLLGFSNIANLMSIRAPLNSGYVLIRNAVLRPGSFDFREKILNMAVPVCLPSSDKLLFGPRVDTNCRSFDFTLKFEDVFLACIPAIVFVFLLPFNIAILYRKPIVCSTKSKLLIIKLVNASLSCSTNLTCDF